MKKLLMIGLIFFSVGVQECVRGETYDMYDFGNVQIANRVEQNRREADRHAFQDDECGGEACASGACICCVMLCLINVMPGCSSWDPFVCSLRGAHSYKMR